MKRLLIAANVAVLLLIGINVNASHDPDGPPVVVERGWHLKSVNQLLVDIDAIENRLDGEHGKKSRRFVRERLAAMRHDLGEMRDDLQSAPIARPGSGPIGFPGPRPPLPPSGPVEMTDAEFVQVLGAYRNAYYTSQKYVVLQEVSAQNWFTTDQVITVMNETYWNTDKVKAAALLYPRVVDRKNWFKVYAALYWESDREELRKLTTGSGKVQ